MIFILYLHDIGMIYVILYCIYMILHMLCFIYIILLWCLCYIIFVLSLVFRLILYLKEFCFLFSWRKVKYQEVLLTLVRILIFCPYKQTFQFLLPASAWFIDSCIKFLIPQAHSSYKLALLNQISLCKRFGIASY